MPGISWESNCLRCTYYKGFSVTMTLNYKKLCAYEALLNYPKSVHEDILKLAYSAVPLYSRNLILPSVSVNRVIIVS